MTCHESLCHFVSLIEFQSKCRGGVECLPDVWGLKFYRNTTRCSTTGVRTRGKHCPGNVIKKRERIKDQDNFIANYEWLLLFVCCGGVMLLTRQKNGNNKNTVYRYWSCMVTTTPKFKLNPPTYHRNGSLACNSYSLPFTNRLTCYYFEKRVVWEWME